MRGKFELFGRISTSIWKLIFKLFSFAILLSILKSSLILLTFVCHILYIQNRKHFVMNEHCQGFTSTKLIQRAWLNPCMYIKKATFELYCSLMLTFPQQTIYMYIPRYFGHFWGVWSYRDTGTPGQKTFPWKNKLLQLSSVVFFFT